MIVIDIGCARYGGDFSIERLIEEFEPDILYGFDPGVNDDYLIEFGLSVPKTKIVLSQKIAWIKDGKIGFSGHGLGGHVDDDGEERACFDIARFITDIALRDAKKAKRYWDPPEIVLKIDAETAEYRLLEHLMSTRVDRLLKLAWIEWHCELCGQGLWAEHAGACPDPMLSLRRKEQIEHNIACETAEWRW